MNFIKKIRQSHKKTLLIVMITLLMGIFQNCDHFQPNNSTSLDNQTSGSSSNNNSGSTNSSKKSRLWPTLISPVDLSELNSDQLVIDWDDKKNKQMGVGIDISETPFNKNIYRHGNIVRVGTTFDRKFSVKVPTDGRKYYLRFLWMQEDGTWGPTDSHVKNGRFTDISFKAHNVKTVNPSGPKSADFKVVKDSIDEALKTQNNWYSFKPSVMKSHHGYHSWPAMAGLAQVYRITNDKKYMDAAVRVLSKWIASGKLIDGDKYLDWEGEDNNKVTINIEHHEWRAAAGVADTLIEIKRSGYESVAGTEAKFLNYLRHDVWEKWQPGHNIHGAGYKRSNVGTYGLDFVGRIGLIAMALDQYDPTPGKNEFANYINSSSGRFGVLFTTLSGLEKIHGVAYMPTWSNGEPHGSGQTVYDTSHAGDMMYSVARAKQLGYDPQGKMQETLDVIERMLNKSIFKTSTGFKEYTDGSGGTNNTNWSSSHGWSMTAGMSTTLKERWVDFYRNNNPYFNSQEERKIWMAGGLLWALNGGSL